MSVQISLPQPLRRPLVHVLCALPLLYWGWQTVLTAQGQFTVISTDPGAVLADKSGFWAINLLLASLALTPLQRLFRLRWVRYRRAVGLWAFVYVLTHILVFYTLILGRDLAEFWHEVVERPYILLGALAALLLLPLVLTSTQAAMRLLKKRWQQLHYLVYPAAILAVIHQLWQVKSFEIGAVIHTLVLVLLLGLRLHWWLRSARRRVS
ncbi:sulfoxide reductase heme-binding subunit YedZ [Natronospirillum operosum]|uniref:Protein-methionine-sulfoxide reductase heme-binding subunit MsrQ n=1 Tax=Natronospirillum operosum TaxID=2759953 RepID=A0A4Z0W3V2_9GAMM|nr:protein-methionine-sulfoxide reductase heme-binding subunit MsrQ [Natronospirillum operosum]TGG91974.1 sulfoxide reductase heme-binding subunit YedZ [Natronospirillum operosum]